MTRSSLSFSLFIAYSFISVVVSTTLTLTNQCNYTVWPRILTSRGDETPSSFTLRKGEMKNFTVSRSWTGRVQTRTFCNQSSTGNFSCLTGESGAPPGTLVEFSIDQSNGMDFYDVSLVDGYNIPLVVVPHGGYGNCSSISCVVDINATCPQELMLTSPAADGKAIACRGPCEAFGAYVPLFCCAGEYADPGKCKPTAYAQIFKKLCPHAYSYPYDAESNTFTCSSADYLITYCPLPTTTMSPPSQTNAPSPGDSRTVPPARSGIEPQGKGKSSISAVTIVAIVVPTTVILALLSIGCYFLRKRARKKYDVVQEDDAMNEITTAESLQFDLSIIETATRKFSNNNKLGQGGFGEVYKGILPNGQEIAVKKLSNSSRQGAEEFKNEVVLLAKLQHRNLVRLLGFCLENEEKLLIYEFMPNKSLDYFLFDPEKQGQLDWPRRYKIIGRIAKGILYLHEDSRLRIIHRDLKCGNILLDRDMNPKIADFGMAKIFEVEETQGNTNRIVGTHGYMSPEYAMEGLFSVKSDVYSFGVLLLEMISGKRNNRFYYSEKGESLLTFAWNLWHVGEGMRLMDPAIEKSSVATEVVKCIQIGLLCVQDDLKKRPTMSSVVFMLANDTIPLPQPKKPTFSVGQFVERSAPSSSSSRPNASSVNLVTLSTLSPR